MKKISIALIFVLVSFGIVSCAVPGPDNSGVGDSVGATPNVVQGTPVVEFDRKTFEREKELCLAQDFEDYSYEVSFERGGYAKLQVLKKNGIVYFRDCGKQNAPFLTADKFKAVFDYHAALRKGGEPYEITDIAGSLASIYAFMNEMVNQDAEGISLAINGYYNSRFHFPVDWVYALKLRELTPEEANMYWGQDLPGMEYLRVSVADFTPNPFPLEGLPLYSINVPQPENGKIILIASRQKVPQVENGTLTIATGPDNMTAAGLPVALQLHAAEGYRLDSLSVTAGDTVIPTQGWISALSNERCEFTMPAADVNVSAMFVPE